MKNLKPGFIILVPALLLAFSSCNKPTDGVYHPDKKISKIYNELITTDSYGDTTMSKELLETWVWENDNLSSITFGYNGVAPHEYLPAVHFFYSDGKLSKIIADDNTIFTFSYKGNKFDKIEVENRDAEMSGSFQFKHSNGKIKEITYEETFSIDYEKKSNKLMHKILGLFMPVQSSQILSKTEESTIQKAQSKGESTISVKNVMKLEWDGKNVEKVTATYYAGNEWSSYEEKIVEKYSYDSKHNPYAGFFNGSFNIMYASENNIVKTETDYGYGPEIESQTYEYDSDDYPIRKNIRYGSYYGGATQYGYLIEYK